MVSLGLSVEDLEESLGFHGGGRTSAEALWNDCAPYRSTVEDQLP